MNKIRTLLTICAFAVASIAIGQEGVEQLTAEKCFLEAPTTILHYIDRGTRLDMIDYFKSGSDKASANAFGNESRITSLDPQSVVVDIDNGVECQFFVLDTRGKKPLIGVIFTLDTPIADSDLSIYTSRWEREEKAFAAPKLADWLTSAGKKQRKQVEEAIPFIMASYVYDPATLTLTITNNTADYFCEADAPAELALLKDKLAYKWNGHKFTLLK